ncbi:MAG: GTPase Era [Microscillaceae bacterium]|nr:GTPase Era [Microscillaceae bacterium]MDW8461288.1 GTPase Era [Cytophagales bacterium]
MIQENTQANGYKAGFVNIIGKPNVGKSTLMNELLGEKLSIVSYKAQTTRHRIIGVLSGANYQIVFSDTPGIIQSPSYVLHEIMLNTIKEAFEDADILVLVLDAQNDDNQQIDTKILPMLEKRQVPLFVLLNKIDKVKEAEIPPKIAFWKAKLAPEVILPISALYKQNTQGLIPLLVEYLPQHPAYYPEDTLTDRTVRFLASEIIREKIFLLYEQELPYCCEVVIDEFKEKPTITVIRAIILTERDSQRKIMIGKDGSMLKKLGIQARQDLEHFLGVKVFLSLYVKVESNWRKRTDKLKKLGYLNS